MRIAVLALIPVFWAGQARADVAQDALADIFKCAELSDATKRLECYDSTTSRAKAALATQPAKDKGTTVETFGLPKSQPVLRTEDFGKAAPEPGPKEITQISATVQEFAKTQRGRAIFILDNGQVWRQLDSDGTELPYPPAGSTMKVTIETGLIGSYNLTIAGRNGLIKVFRLK